MSSGDILIMPPPVRKFDVELTTFLATPDSLSIWSHGWCNGGCWLFADAVMQIIPARATQLQTADHGHTFVRIGEWLVDGEGVWTDEGMSSAWGEPVVPYENWYNTEKETYVVYWKGKSRSLAIMLELAFNWVKIADMLEANPPIYAKPRTKFVTI